MQLNSVCYSVHSSYYYLYISKETGIFQPLHIVILDSSMSQPGYLSAARIPTHFPKAFLGGKLSWVLQFSTLISTPIRISSPITYGSQEHSSALHQMWPIILCHVSKQQFKRGNICHIPVLETKNGGFECIKFDSYCVIISLSSLIHPFSSVKCRQKSIS